MNFDAARPGYQNVKILHKIENVCDNNARYQ
jgi:hypothetical protein